MFEGDTAGRPGGDVGAEGPKRRCARPGCTEFAIATLTYDYSGSAAWLDDLAAEAHPMTHDLCARHADRLSAPNGWVLHDRRQATPFLRRTA
ncbi:hypothetical protein B7486_66900 [cyanobacterium TDX16]|nr:hypothetical protein B7486_66900 [cyanobacterium TDX16]